MLLLFAGALILSTPLSIAMNLQEQKYKKIDEFRQAYFYMKKSYSKNKNKDLRLDNAKYFSELLIKHNEQNWHSEISMHDILSKKITHDVADIYMNNFRIIETIQNNNESSELVINCIGALHGYFSHLSNNTHNRKPFIRGLTKAIKDGWSTSNCFIWPLEENSLIKKLFTFLLKKKEKKYDEIICYESSAKDVPPRGFPSFYAVTTSLMLLFLYLSALQTSIIPLHDCHFFIHYPYVLCFFLYTVRLNVVIYQRLEWICVIQN